VSTDHFLITLTKAISPYSLFVLNSAVKIWARIFSDRFKPHTSKKKNEGCDSQSCNLWRNDCQN